MLCKHLSGVLVLAATLSSSGCLAIGGKTYSESPETSARLSALEARVGTLEHAFSAVHSPPSYRDHELLPSARLIQTPPAP